MSVCVSCVCVCARVRGVWTVPQYTCQEVNTVLLSLTLSSETNSQSIDTKLLFALPECQLVQDYHATSDDLGNVIRVKFGVSQSSSSSPG